MKRERHSGWSGSLAVMVIALALAASACSSKSTPSAGSGASSPSPSPSPSPTSSPTESSGGGGGGSMTASLQAGAGGLKFSPTTVTIAQGGTLTVTNVGTVTHTFTIQSKGINQVMTPGQSATIAISLAPGTYPFVCTIHQSRGMTGTLVVT